MANLEKLVSQPEWHTELRCVNLIPRGMDIRGIVLHDTAGSGMHNDTKYLAKPGDGRKVGVDFTIERNGLIWKLNPDLPKFCAPHAGRNTTFLGLSNGRVNRATVGIELVQSVKLNLTPMWPIPQVMAVAHLCAWLKEEFNLTSDRITTHRQIVTDGSRSDPRQFPFEGMSGFWHLFWSYFRKAGDFTKSQTEQLIP